MSDPSYPIGKYVPQDAPDGSTLHAWIEEVSAAPARLRAAVDGLSDAQLDTPYRDGGWTLRQVAHHVPDSHLNSYVRFKLALTEVEPVVRTYDEALWAELPDARGGSIAVSLALLEHLHERWVRLLRAMTPADYARTLRYPGQEQAVSLGRMLGLYAWHGKHHTAQVTTLRAKRGW
jgi:uncharacterized damage-inducible protein DinB